MESKKSKPQKYFWEILALLFGGFMIYFGIIDEINHVSSVSYNSKGCMFVNTGAFDALLGLLVIIGSSCSIYAKNKNKSNQ